MYFSHFQESESESMSATRVVTNCGSYCEKKRQCLPRLLNREEIDHKEQLKTDRTLLIMTDVTDDKSNPFTQYYAQLLHQGNMLQDLTRTGTYRHAFLSNAVDFKDKIVLDVGTGTGILALFACQAGAKKVYAVEASQSAEVARALVESNGYSDRIEVIQAKLEDVTLPEKVDIIISEPIGFLLGEKFYNSNYRIFVALNISN